MIYSFEAELLNFAIHRVGNPLQDERYTLSESPVVFHDDIMKSLLMQYFLIPFEKTSEVFRLFHSSGDLELNEVYHFTKQLFDREELFIETSKQLAKHLYSVSNHPKIKSGEFYVVLFKNLQIEGELLEAIGIFKSETKESYLKVNASLDISYEQDAINISKLDKGCLIFNTEAEEGFKVVAIDATGKTGAAYWIDEFLGAAVRNDNYRQTSNILNITKNFITEKLDDEFELNKSDKIDLLNRSMKYFKEKESFDVDEFTGEVLGNEQAVSSFKSFKENYELEFETPIPDSFEISDSAVKKQAKLFNKVLNLDRNFKVQILGNKELIEKGFDADKNMNFYKLYFREEV